MKEVWQFEAYTSEEEHRNCNPFFLKVFYNYDELKDFSVEHSAEWTQEYPDYCSDYFKWE
jgi:hypothetical protein